MTLSAKCSPRSCVLNSLRVKPALEKHLSEEADVAGMQRYFKASCFKMAGKLRICGPPLKSLNFGDPVWGDPYFGIPKFIFSLYLLISCV